MSSRPRRARAYALVELLLAAVVLALCIIPITGSISSMRTQATQARLESQVQAYLQWYILQVVDTDTTASGSASSTTGTQTLTGGVVVNFSQTITAVPGYTKLFLVTMTATWTSPTTPTRTDTMTMSTYDLTI